MTRILILLAAAIAARSLYRRLTADDPTPWAGLDVALRMEKR